MDDLIQLRDTLRECADSVEEIIQLGIREEAGEKITKSEQEAAMGKMMVKFMNMQTIANKM